VAGDELDLEFTAGMTHLHALGPRAGGEFLSELGVRRMVRAETDLLLRRYRRLDPVVIAALGGDRFSAAPLRVFPGWPAMTRLTAEARQAGEADLAARCR
jgi:hypothetical protein